MRYQQGLVIVAIALGAILGSTLATIGYLGKRQATTVAPTATVPPVVFSPTPDPSPLVSPSLDVRDPDSASLRPAPTSASTPTPSPQASPTGSPVSPDASEFSQFRRRLLGAIARRDAKFIQAIVTPETQWSFGGSLSLDTYKIDNPQSAFWQHLDKAVSAGCIVDPQARVASQEAGSQIWVCPATAKRPIYNFGWNGSVAIMGRNVNVRTDPGTGGAVITKVSDTLLSFDQNTYNQLPERSKEQVVDTPDGWTPVVLPNGQRGWVASEYVYHEPRDYRVSFVRSRGQWRLRYFLRGDGN